MSSDATPPPPGAAGPAPKALPHEAPDAVEAPTPALALPPPLVLVALIVISLGLAGLAIFALASAWQALGPT